MYLSAEAVPGPVLRDNQYCKAGTACFCKHMLKFFALPFLFSTQSFDEVALGMCCRKKRMGVHGSSSVSVASRCPASQADLMRASVIEGHLNCNKPYAGGLKPVCYAQGCSRSNSS